MLDKDEIRAIALAMAEIHAEHHHAKWKRLLFINVGVTLAVLVGAELLHVEVLFKGVEVVGAAGVHWMFFGRAE